MNEPRWPLSAAAAQLLIDSSETAPAATTNASLAKLAIKELVLRGHLRVTAVKKRWLRQPVVTVATYGPTLVAADIPETPAFLARNIPKSAGEDLAALLRRARKGHPHLYSERLRSAVYGELQSHGLIEERYRKALGFWPSSFQALTVAGVEARERILADRNEAFGLSQRLRDDPAGVAAAITGLGVLVLLLSNGLALTAAVADRLTKTTAGSAEAIDAFDPGFNVLSAVLENLDQLVESASQFEGLDEMIETISRALDSGTSDGGGYSGGGSGCGGGSSCSGGGSGCGGGGGCGGGS